MQLPVSPKTDKILESWLNDYFKSTVFVILEYVLGILFQNSIIYLNLSQNQSDCMKNLPTKLRKGSFGPPKNYKWSGGKKINSKSDIREYRCRDRYCHKISTPIPRTIRAISIFFDTDIDISQNIVSYRKNETLNYTLVEYADMQLAEKLMVMRLPQYVFNKISALIVRCHVRTRL